MFRRNKAKLPKSKLEDDMVAPLTGPDVLSSSSSAELSNVGGGRKLGMRKKKHALEKGKDGISIAAGGIKNTSSRNGMTRIDPASNPRTQISIQQNNVPESANPPQAIQTRSPPSKYNDVSTKETSGTGARPPPQPSAELGALIQPSTKNPETRDDHGNIRRRSSSRSNSAHLPSLVYASELSSSNDTRKPQTAAQRVMPVGPASPSTLVPKLPPPLIANGGVHVSGTANAVPMMRSGWSMQSNDSSAMNSDHYIQSLDNLPSLRPGKAHPMLSAQPEDTMRGKTSDNVVRMALSRQFGRNYPPQKIQQRWYVNVGKPRWDNDERRFKYKISLSRHPVSSAYDDDESSHLSIDSTTTRRSLQDFVWLEQALRAEYNGALIVPILSLVLYFETFSDDLAAQDDELSTVITSNGSALDSVVGENGAHAVVQSFKLLEGKMERNEIVNESTLSNWLSDIINGVRGNGEVLLYNYEDVVQSEAMETFLYRNSETPNGYGWSLGNTQRASSLGSPFDLFSWKDRCHGKTLLEGIMENPLDCIFSMNPACVGDKKSKAQDAISRMSIAKMCSSGTTGVFGMEHCNSDQYMSEAMADSAWFQSSSQSTLPHSTILESERDLIASYLRSIPLAMSKIQLLIKDEYIVGQCWKRMAISLSNLFSVEKDLEQAHIGDQIKCSKKNQPFRKLRKSSIDEALRLLARGKIDRSIPSLRILQNMLNAYYTDLNSTIPAFREHSEALYYLRQSDEMHSINSNPKKSLGSSPYIGNTDWLLSSLDQWRHKLYGGGSVASELDHTSDAKFIDTAQTKALKSRVLQNEKTLQSSITLLCRASPLRNARMAWWYLKTEAKQALNIHTAATTLGHKLSIDDDAAAAIKDRNYDGDEKKDNEAEIELVKRILDLGSSVCDEKHEKSDQQASRRNAIQIATEQLGRWNAKAALALMEAAGVEDAEVQIDETSRELRHVRKFAISLREKVASCLESAKVLEATYSLSSENSVQISRSRREFWAAISTVFSGKGVHDDMKSKGPDTRILASAGIDVTDCGGWLGHNTSFDQPNRQRQNCGEAARQYLKKRDNQASILISRIVKLLNDYEHRLQGIESFVYMHCVGIQLEKHCSRARSKALSAWEKRTDISTAINVATKKRIPKLVQELKVKLDSLPQVSHTTVIKRKEEHLASKALKSDLHRLANRRFGRAQEVSTENVIAVMRLWAKHEESVATEEVKALGEVVQEVELSVQREDVNSALNQAVL